MADPDIRRTGRVILLDPAGRVLLLRFLVEQAGEPFEFWATPGGRAEEGETDHHAATRELAEELGLSVPLEGPVHSHASTFEVNGQTWRGQDVFFTARCGPHDPVFSGGTDAQERATLQEMRWWVLDDVEMSPTPVFPPDLVRVLRRLVS